MTQLSECLKSESFLYPERVSSLGSRRQRPAATSGCACLGCEPVPCSQGAAFTRKQLHTSGEVRGRGGLGWGGAEANTARSPEPSAPRQTVLRVSCATPPQPHHTPISSWASSKCCSWHFCLPEPGEGHTILVSAAPGSLRWHECHPRPDLIQSWESQQQDGVGRQAQGAQGLSSTSQAQGQGTATTPGPPTWPRPPKGGNYPSSLRKGARSLAPQ